MKLTDLQDLTVPGGPYATVALDTSRADEAGPHEVELRWRAQRAELASAGADDADLDALEQAVLRPSGRGGSTGIFAVAAGGRIVHERVLPQAPVRDEAAWQALPHLMPLVRALDGGARYVLVETDHTGADITVVDAGSGDPVDDVVEQAESAGGHDVIRKLPSGGWSHRRYQARADDSWQQNAAGVAHDLDSIVRDHRPDLVLVTGQAQSRSFVMDSLSPAVAQIALTVDGGSRHDDMAPDDAGVHPAVVEALAAHVHERRRAGLADLAEEIGKQDQAVQGLSDVIGALRRGQVHEVFFVDDPTSTDRLWVGPDPLTVGSEDDVAALGVEGAHEVRADSAVVAAAAATDAAVTVIPGHPDDAGDLLGIVDLAEGIGARLRYSDRSTPHQT